MERAQDKKTNNKKTAEKEDDFFVEGIKITNPQKLIYASPPVTKLAVAAYYAAVKERMLPFAAGRVLSVVRCNKGIGGDCFFKKHPVAAGDGVAVIPIANAEGEQSKYFYLENVKGLVTEAQLGTIEFHVWGSRVDNLERPDMMVFDLDPDEGMELGQIRQGVRDMKEVLDELSLVSFLKTSGGKGYHLVVPLKPTAGWDVFHDFARKMAELMESRWPDRYTSNIRKNRRQNKIFIDWVRNGRGATSVAPYSLRARPGACVSMPIAWKELDTVAPNGIDMAAALKRIKKPDPWQNFYLSGQQLKL